MSRDQELTKQYAEITGMSEKDKMAPEWNWYLFEQEGQMPIVHCTQRLAEYKYDLDKMKQLGWTATPITLFRKR